MLDHFSKFSLLSTFDFYEISSFKRFDFSIVNRVFSKDGFKDKVTLMERKKYIKIWYNNKKTRQEY